MGLYADSGASRGLMKSMDLEFFIWPVMTYRHIATGLEEYKGVSSDTGLPL
jgi:hypothetical protein